MLRTKLVLERFSEHGGLVERKIQPGRSFLKGFIELLYVQHAEIPYSGPWWMRNIDQVNHNVDTYSSSPYFKANLRVGSTPGGTFVYVPVNAYRFPVIWSATFPGASLGLVIGNGTAPVTPTDRRLDMIFGPGKRPPDGSPVRVEYCDVGDDADYEIYGTRWCAAPFIPRFTHRLTSVKVKIYREGNPGDLAVRIRGANMQPSSTDDPDPGSGLDLASGAIPQAAMPGSSPGALIECAFPSPVDVYKGHLYYIILYISGGDASNCVHWRYDTADPLIERPIRNQYGNYRQTSSNSGASWSESTNSAWIFEEYGQSIGEFEIGGCDLHDMTISNPNAQFTIKRYFANLCGQALAVNEVGLVAFAGRTYESGGYTYPSGSIFLIARDLVSPTVVVNNGEILRVSYIPQITV